MSPRRTAATTLRVLRQLGHDHRTLALLMVVPVVLLGLLSWMFSGTPGMFERIGPSLLGIFPFIMLFLVTSVTTLHERSSGTLERLLAMPVGKADIVLGYAGAFGIIAVVQATIASLAAIYLFDMNIVGPQWLLVAVALGNALLGCGLGLLASAYARTEFQATQFMPAFVLPQLLLCGLLVPIAQLPTVLHWIANALPLTYAVDAMQRVTSEVTPSGRAYLSVAVVFGLAMLAVALAATTLRRQTK